MLPYQYSLSMQWQNNSPPFWIVAKRHIQYRIAKKTKQHNNVRDAAGDNA